MHHRRCDCPRCWEEERYEHRRMQDEINYRMQREVEYKMRMLQGYTMPSISVGVDFGFEDPAKVTTMVTKPWQPMTLALDIDPKFAKEYPTIMKQLMAANWPKKETKDMGNVVKRIKALGLSKEDKLLRKFQIVDDAGDLTVTGKEALWAILLETNKATLVGKLTELEAAEKKR